ncbi:MAG: alpha/beta fold hydrolase [Actinomycetota bacterium]|nr:alpha/beta fold hydrolase [Actinomycetota bacterium]
MTSGETLSRAGGAGEAAGVTGVVVVAHGGMSMSAEPTAALQPAVIRMIPVARAIQTALRGSGAVVCRPRFEVRGWNGAKASPVDDLSRILDGVGDQYGPVPIVLVGHSMGARAALRVAGHPAVAAVAGLAPWLPPGELVDQLAGRRILLVHGHDDRVTNPDDTWAFAERAGSVTEVTAIEVRSGEHAMLRRAHLWHSIAAEFTRIALQLPSTSRDLDAALARTTRGSRTTL